MHLTMMDMNQRKPPKKRYSSYIPPTQFPTLEQQVTTIPTSPKRSQEEGIPHKPRRNYVPSHFNAIQNAVSKLARIDDFDLEDLGYGFFSDVFKVTHKLTGKVMVLKRNKDTNTKLNILREVQLMNRLSHPNILKYMGVCVHEGQLHALTEFINGGDLDQLIENTSVALSWTERISIAIDVACGIKYLHSMGIIHRDMTAKNCLVNILVNDKGEKSYKAIVADLGLAEKIPKDLSVENKLSIVGTPYYMAPEVLCNKPYNDKADVFSFGIIQCQLIARVSADPDKLPRTHSFGLDKDVFYQLSLQANDTPPHESFLAIAYSCCEVEAMKRAEIGSALTKLYKALNSPAMKPAKTETTDVNGNTIVHGSSPSRNQKRKYRAPTSPAHLLRSYSDLTNEVVAANNSCHHDNAILQTAFMNPFSNLEYLDVGAQKIIDTPSAEMLALTFDLPIPGETSSPVRFRKSDSARPSRPSSLLVDEADNVFQRNSTSSRRSSTCSQENYATYFHNIHNKDSHKSTPPSPLREINFPSTKDDVHNARMRAVLFSPHGRKYSSWWLSCQRTFLNDTSAVLSPVLSTVTKKSHKIRRSVSLPNLNVPADTQSNESSCNKNAKTKNNRHSIHISQSTYSNTPEEDYLEEEVVYRKSTSSTRNKSRSRTIDNVFHDMNSLECLPEEVAAENINSDETKHKNNEGKENRSVSFSDDVTNLSIASSSQTFTDETISSCSSSSGSGTGILMALQSGVSSFSKRKRSIIDDKSCLKTNNARTERNSRDSGYNDDEICTSLDNLDINLQ